MKEQKNTQKETKWTIREMQPHHWEFRHINAATIPISVAARSKAWVCRCSLDGVVGLNPTEGMDVCLLWLLCVVR
jgi:hypothetical protein